MLGSVRHRPTPTAFPNSFSETVWKIAEGVSSTLLWRQEAADRDFFDPSWPLRSPDSGSIPNFQTVSPRLSDKSLERVMNSIRNGSGMRETEIAREPS